MIDRGIVAVTGSGTRGRQYKIANAMGVHHKCAIVPGLDETKLWRQVASPLVSEFELNEKFICNYGLTEMVNNAIDHSNGSTLNLSVEVAPGWVQFTVQDDGVGIFKKIANALQLESPAQAILELSKGKFTTDPAKHSGEGIFFTSRMFDRFSIMSGNHYFRHYASGKHRDWIMSNDVDPIYGTVVDMRLELPSTREAEGVFEEYRTGEPGSGFDRTVIPLELAKVGGEFLVSRSQARRVLARVNRFKEVVLDFSGVDH